MNSPAKQEERWNRWCGLRGEVLISWLQFCCFMSAFNLTCVSLAASYIATSCRSILGQTDRHAALMQSQHLPTSAGIQDYVFTLRSKGPVLSTSSLTGCHIPSHSKETECWGNKRSINVNGHFQVKIIHAIYFSKPNFFFQAIFLVAKQ